MMTFNIPDITWDKGHFFNLLIMHYVRVGLHGPGWLYVLRILPRGDVPLSTPRARATDLGRGPNLRMGSGRAPCVPRSREHEERPAAGREKNAEGWKEHTYLYIYIYHSARKCKHRWCINKNAKLSLHFCHEMVCPAAARNIHDTLFLRGVRQDLQLMSTRTRNETAPRQQ